MGKSSRTVRGTWLLTALLWSFSAVMAPAEFKQDNSPPDRYEGEPFNDDTAETLNYVIPGEPNQPHTIDTVDDEDWAILMLSSLSPDGTLTSINYTIDFRNVVIPPNSGLILEIFDSGRPLPGDSGDQILVTAPDDILVSTDGIAPIEEVSIKLSLFSQTATDDDAISYELAVSRDTGANNALVGSIGVTTNKGAGNPVGVLWFGLEGTTADGTTIDNLDALRVYRSLGDAIFTQDEIIAELPAPLIGCDDCEEESITIDGLVRTLDTTGRCFLYVDEEVASLPLFAGQPVFYQIKAVRGGVEDIAPWTPISPIVLTNLVRELVLPECAAQGETPTPTASPTPVPPTPHSERWQVE